MAVWNRENADHLLRRAGFGGTPQNVDKFFASYSSVEEAVADIIAFPTKKNSPPRRKDVTDKSLQKMWRWWLKRMIKSKKPADAVREKLVLFFHNFLVSGIGKQPELRTLSWQNRRFRINCNGNFKALIREMNRDPANLFYLDGILNAATQDGIHASPNENWGRELMELFTLGPFEMAADGLDDPALPNYDENDVHALARVSTGWLDIDVKQETGVFVLDGWDGGAYSDTADSTPDDIVLFGQVANSWRFDEPYVTANPGDDVLTHIMDEKFNAGGHNQCAMFVARKVWEWYAYPAPVPGLRATLEPIADNFFASGYEMQTLLFDVFTNDEFYSITAKTRTVTNPTDFVVQALRRLGVRSNAKYVGEADAELGELVSQMGMTLFNPPNVAGWPGGLNWITSGTLLKRLDFAKLLAAADFGSSRIKFRKFHDGFPLGQAAVPVADVVDAVLVQLGMDQGAMALLQTQKDVLVAYASDDGATTTLDLSDEFTNDMTVKVRGVIALALQSAENQVF